GPDGVGGGRGDVRVDVADGDGDAFGQAGPGGGLGGEGAGQAAEGGEGDAADLLADLAGGELGGEAGEAGVQLGQELLGRVGLILKNPLVAGGADVAALHPGELPDDPVGGLDPPLGPGVGLGVLLQDLQRLGELPLGGDLAAVAGQPALAAPGRQLVDPVGVRLGGVVLPQLGPGVRPLGGLGAEGGAVGGGGQYGAGGEVGADADHVAGLDSGGGEGGGHGLAQHVDPVLRRLQGPVGAELQAGAGSSRSMTPCAYSWTALPSSAPSDTRTTTARPDSVPKSTPTTNLLAFTLISRGCVRRPCMHYHGTRAAAAVLDLTTNPGGTTSRSHEIGKRRV